MDKLEILANTFQKVLRLYPQEVSDAVQYIILEKADRKEKSEEIAELFLTFGKRTDLDGNGLEPQKKKVILKLAGGEIVIAYWENLLSAAEKIISDTGRTEQDEKGRTTEEEEIKGQISLFESGPFSEENDQDMILSELDFTIRELKKRDVRRDESDEPMEKESLQPVPFDFSEESASGFHFIPENTYYENGPKAKCRGNLEAIKLCKQLMEEGRNATEEEQRTLVKYVGWGGLADALTPGKKGWESEYALLEEVLSPEEYTAASASVLTAYYTDPMIIRQMYKALNQFGFSSGNILDPAAGTGNFLSAIPEDMSASQLFGVEIEPIAGNIAKLLHPEADIQIKGFEDTAFSDNFFDVIVGNIPFSAYTVNDRRYARYHFRIHDYFIAKSLDLVRPGGIIAVITSMYTMDKKNQSIRKYIAQRAELIGAVRLPDNAFKSIAGTEVTTDILFLKKRQEEWIPDENNTSWLCVEKDENNIPCNSYFIDHPEMVLGTLVQEQGMYGKGDAVTCKAWKDSRLEDLLEEALGRLHAVYEKPVSVLEDDNETKLDEMIPAKPEVRNYCYANINGRLYYRENSSMYLQEIGEKKEERIKGMLEVRTALRELMDFQLAFEAEESPAYHAQFQQRLNNLNHSYDRFIKQYGFINSRANIMALAKDNEAPLLRSIEDPMKDERGTIKKGEYQKGAVFFKATIQPWKMPEQADTVDDALRISLTVHGKLDLDYMQYLYRNGNTACSKETILEELGVKAYQDPDGYEAGDPYSGWILAEEYLSGNVKSKLERAVLAAEEPDRFTRNVKALEAVQPEPLSPEDIGFSLGSTWIPVNIYEDFMYEKLKTSNRDIHIEFSPYAGSYYISGKSWEKDSVPVNTTYGTQRMNAYEILEDTLNLHSVQVKDRVDYKEDGKDKVKYVLNRKETLLAREKQAQLQMEFSTWLFQDPIRGRMLTAYYNDRFNTIRSRIFHGDDLILPDLNETIKLRKNQLDVIAKGLYSGKNLLNAQDVGAGKTMSTCVLIHERKRLGLCNKPMIAVPNHTLGQWATEYLRLYPNANILVATKKDLEKKNRQRFISRVATGDYECIIIPHSSFEKIAISRSRQLESVEREIVEIEAMIQEQKAISGKSWSLKQMELYRKNLQAKYDNLYNADKKDDLIDFEELGVDNLIVDEAHIYKNDYVYTKMDNVAGLIGKGSQRAMDMRMKCHYINEITNESGIVFLTATPITNSMAVRP
nr:N-6 DNA methylase [uncultured Eisenbergiella sp.]